MNYQIGDYVCRNEQTWIVSEFDGWGRGVGIGQIVEPPFPLDEDSVDVRWPAGRCFEFVAQLLPAERPKDGESGK